jgi:PTS system nitrogen regulatory IIA component
LIFVLLVPANATDLHLQILSELAQLFSDKQLREELNTLPDANQVWQRISTWEPYGTEFA